MSWGKLLGDALLNGSAGNASDNRPQEVVPDGYPSIEYAISNAYIKNMLVFGGSRGPELEDKTYNGIPGSVQPKEILKDCVRIQGDEIKSRIKKFVS